MPAGRRFRWSPGLAHYVTYCIWSEESTTPARRLPARRRPASETRTGDGCDGYSHTLFFAMAWDIVEAID